MDWQGIWSGFLQGLANFAGDLVLAALIFLGGWLLARLAARLTKKAISKGGLAPCAANGANEEAVKLFLQDQIGFLDIGRLVEGVVDSQDFGQSYTLQDVYECDRMARAYVREHL